MRNVRNLLSVYIKKKYIPVLYSNRAKITVTIGNCILTKRIAHIAEGTGFNEIENVIQAYNDGVSPGVLRQMLPDTVSWLLAVDALCDHAKAALQKHYVLYFATQGLTATQYARLGFIDPGGLEGAKDVKTLCPCLCTDDETSTLRFAPAECRVILKDVGTALLRSGRGTYEVACVLRLYLYAARLHMGYLPLFIDVLRETSYDVETDILNGVMHALRAGDTTVAGVLLAHTNTPSPNDRRRQNLLAYILRVYLQSAS